MTLADMDAVVDRTHGFAILAPRLRHGWTTGSVSSDHHLLERKLGKLQLHMQARCDRHLHNLVYTAVHIHEI
jgi:hypothetical protein